jgi:hypothetical protein
MVLVADVPLSILYNRRKNAPSNSCWLKAWLYFLLFVVVVVVIGLVVRYMILSFTRLE